MLTAKGLRRRSAHCNDEVYDDGSTDPIVVDAIARSRRYSGTWADDVSLNLRVFDCDDLTELSDNIHFGAAGQFHMVSSACDAASAV